jgi:N-acetyl-anhydromuramyl-L-alanine amidase AmpD
VLTFKPRASTTRIIVHASHTAPSQSNIEHFLRVKGRTMGLIDVGYHYIIPRVGMALPCRPHNVQGAHIRGKANRDSIGVCLAGGRAEEVTFDAEGRFVYTAEDNFTLEQVETMHWLVDYLTRIYGPLPVVGHYEIRPGRPHKCPPTNMEKFRSWSPVNSI